MKKLTLSVAIVLTALATQPATARDRHVDRHSEYRERHHENNRSYRHDQDYGYDRYADRRHGSGYNDYYAPQRDRYYDGYAYNYDRHARRSVSRHHRRKHR